ncbi:SPOSA6832_01374 [Sporobolomyces salmonicolor]|uniref:SPOSA6832_01374-mRNA-1:cds n=1 Tax=Sporidiobolus salmonicolor TaxID=5005 RepID=A0A0D6EJL7_SPOSA|nr:SPOSA6832_01374 [Sporobolomyces salmonicolor]
MSARLAARAPTRLFQRARPLHTSASTSYGQPQLRNDASTSAARPKDRYNRPHGSNPAMSFPCVDQNEVRTARLLEKRQRELSSSGASASASSAASYDTLGPASSSPAGADDAEGPEPAYANVVTGYQVYHHPHPFPLDYGGHLPEFTLAYETWGTLNADRSNAVLLHTGLSASSHAHSTAANPAEGWWERFIGPGKALDTNRFFVICTNVLGGCYGSTGPSSLDPSDGQPYATRFPIVSIFDMVRAQFELLTSLGIDRLAASVGSSMGGMQSIAAAHLEPERVGKIVSISGTARSSPASIAMRHAQRSVLMADPNWKRGFYYDNLPPHTGMKLARQIATITYRSGPEWEQRFSRRRRDLSAPAISSDPSASHLPSPPVLCPDFLIETYLDHQGEQFCLKYDANSLIYVSKAMDLFDMSQDALDDLEARRAARDAGVAAADALCPVPPAPSSPSSATASSKTSDKPSKPFISSLPSSHAYLPSLTSGLSRLRNHPTLVMGVQSDTLFPIEQQRELAECLKANGNPNVVYYELNQPWGHDTFLLDVTNVGSAVKGFLEGHFSAVQGGKE